MPKNNIKKIKEDENNDFEIIESDETDIAVKEKKAERFFEELPTDKEVKILIYRKSPINKTWEQCGKARWMSDGEFDPDDIIDEYGAGLYQFYAHVRGDNGKMTFLDSCIKRFAETPKKEIKDTLSNSNTNISDLRKQALEEMKLMREIFPKEEKSSDNNVLVLKLMEMMQQISEKQTNAMRESEHRMYEALEKISNKSTNSKQEFIDMFELFQNFQNNFGGNESSPLEKLITTVSPVLPGLISQFTTKPETKQDVKTIDMQKIPTEEDLINSIYQKVPDFMKERLTLQNFDLVINNLSEKNPHIAKDILIKVGKKILNEGKK